MTTEQLELWKELIACLQRIEQRLEMLQTVIANQPQFSSGAIERAIRNARNSSY